MSRGIGAETRRGHLLMMSKECWGNLADGGCGKRKKKKKKEKEKKKNQIKTLLLIGGVELLVGAGCC